MTPQTMAVITRTFPAASRGQAMALWGATAGVAILVGPLVGGLLVDGPGWEWIFFINVPVGVVAFVLAARLVPAARDAQPLASTGSAWRCRRSGMFLLVFGIQEGETYDWGTITGFLSVPLLIAVGRASCSGVFIWWQAATSASRCVPLRLFRDRNFSLSNIAITTVGFSITAMAFPFMLYAQAVRGLSPDVSRPCCSRRWRSSPGALAPVVGRLVDRVHPRDITAVGLGLTLGLAVLARPRHAPGRRQIVAAPAARWRSWASATPSCGARSAATATRNLPLSSAGAGSGIYNTTRQVGAVLGSAAIAAVIRGTAERPTCPALPSDLGAMQGAGAQRCRRRSPTGSPRRCRSPCCCPAAVLLVGVVAVLFFERPASHPH